MEEPKVPYDITPLPVFPIEIGTGAWILAFIIGFLVFLLIRYLSKPPPAPTPESAFLVVERSLLEMIKKHRGEPSSTAYLNKLSLIGRRYLSVLLRTDLSTLTDGELRKIASGRSGAISEALLFLSSYEEIRYGGSKTNALSEEVANRTLELFRDCNNEVRSSQEIGDSTK